MTTIAGTYKLCGRDFAIDFTCTGRQCDVFDDYPDTTCVADGDALSCTNGLSCDKDASYTSSFSFNQSDVQVFTQDHIVLKDMCEELDITSDGTKAGTDVKHTDIDNCEPKVPDGETGTGSSSTASSTATSGSATESATSEPSTTPHEPHGPFTPGYHGMNSTKAHEPTSKTEKPPTTAKTLTYTFVDTTVYSITTCPSKPHTCQLGELTTEYVTSYTTYCPGSPGETGSPPPGHSAEGESTYTAPPTGGHEPGQTYPAGGVSSSPTYPAGVSSSAPGCNPPASSSIYPPGAGSTASGYNVPGSSPTPSQVACTLLLFLGSFTPGNTVSPADNAIRGAVVADIPPVNELASELVDILVQGIFEVVCDGTAGWGLNQLADAAVAKVFGIEFTTSCRAVANGIVLITAPEIELAPFGTLLVNFAAARLCSFLLAEAFQIPKFIDQCVTGVCKFGACTSETCRGETCETFTTCGAGSTCVCASTAEGTGYCVGGQTPCLGLPDCETSDNCSAGQICAVQTCCQRNVCVGASFCGGSKGANAAALLLRSWQNATIANLGIEVPDDD
ncbi:hypothetical protein EDB81DRAFT_890547 [Dactylonectria macrodidyma]|uniref:Uncharacterized protein n=1 Tax=Dactylonectria macrodidyma TaxID=307937 RepID=A0A9P9DSI6_9HYPO|nr:hypothetical protein EDB81DRAFT_890547 [Dactylonectria macrodidyma]